MKIIHNTDPNVLTVEQLKDKKGGILVHICNGQLFKVEPYNHGDREIGFCVRTMESDLVSYWTPGPIENIIDRIAKCDVNSLHYFTNLVDFAQAIIDNKWTL